MNQHSEIDARDLILCGLAIAAIIALTIAWASGWRW